MKRAFKLFLLFNTFLFTFFTFINISHAAPILFASETLVQEGFYSIDAANGNETFIGLHPAGC
jgi:hypothetical protein